MRLAALLVALVLAGCSTSGEALDTGEIAPEGSAVLVFAEPGMVAIHCHPHPFMEQKVRVMEGALAEDVHVHVLDGNSTDEYRFDPATLDVGAGSNVTYHNHGTQVHTATEDAHASH